MECFWICWFKICRFKWNLSWLMNRWNNLKWFKRKFRKRCWNRWVSFDFLMEELILGKLKVCERICGKFSCLLRSELMMFFCFIRFNVWSNFVVIWGCVVKVMLFFLFKVKLLKFWIYLMCKLNDLSSDFKRLKRSLRKRFVNLRLKLRRNCIVNLC